MKPRKKPRKPRTVWVMALNGQPMQVRSSKADAEYAIHRMEHDVPGKWTCFQCVEKCKETSHEPTR